MAKLSGTAKGKGTVQNAAEKRLAILKEFLKNEPDKKSLYAKDLRASIKDQEQLVKNASKEGYQMVEK